MWTGPTTREDVFADFMRMCEANCVLDCDTFANKDSKHHALEEHKALALRRRKIPAA